MTPDREPRNEGIEAALAEHRRAVVDVLKTGDAQQIKRLYVELGTLLEDATHGDATDAPTLSLPETTPVVTGLVASVTGLVLDAGCGPNPVASLILGQTPERTMIGLDIGEGTVRLARSRAEEFGVELLGVVADLEALPFRDGVFAASVCDDTIEHLPDDAKGASELARVLAPGGRLVLATPNRFRLDVFYRRLRDLRHRRVRPRSAYYAATSHLREYTTTELKRLVQPYFRLVEEASVPWPGGKVAQTSSRVTARGPGRYFGRVLVFVLTPR